MTNNKNNKKALGTYEIAKICQVTPPTVGRWIEEGKLPAFTTGGGHHRVWNEDLMMFLKAHNMPIPASLSGHELPRILVVDDESPAREFITGVIRHFYPDMSVEEAKDGFEAGHKIALLEPDLVILDLRLPDMDGVRVCETIRKNDPLKRIKVLAVTGDPSHSLRKRVSEAGADGFLQKPFEPKQLADEIKRLL